MRARLHAVATAAAAVLATPESPWPAAIEAVATRTSLTPWQGVTSRSQAAGRRSLTRRRSRAPTQGPQPRATTLSLFTRALPSRGATRSRRRSPQLQPVQRLLATTLGSTAGAFSRPCTITISDPRPTQCHPPVPTEPCSLNGIIRRLASKSCDNL